MKIQLFLLFSLALSISLFGQNKEAQKKFEKEIVSYFGSGEVKMQEVTNSETNDKIYRLTRNNSFTGYAILASAKGRMESFDIMVIYNTHSEVEFIKVLVYRSSHGQEITNKNWLKQFYAKTGLFTYGKDIQAISGATLSAKSITEKINNLTILVTEQTKSQNPDL
jgi:hypothetical protein